MAFPVNVVGSDTLPLKVYDEEISAIQDDGSDEGIIKTKLSLGGLVLVPVIGLKPLTTSTGTSSANKNYRSLYTINGSYTSMVLQNLAGAVGKYVASFAASFRGKQCGIVYRKSATSGRLTAVVNGIAKGISINEVNSYWQNEPLDTDTDFAYLLFDGLPDGKHDLQVILPPNADGTPNGAEVVGFLLESRVAYAPMPRTDRVGISGSFLQTTSPFVVPLTDTTSTLFFRAIKEIWYINEDSIDPGIKIMLEDDVIWMLTAKAGESVKFVAGDSGIIPYGSSSAKNLRHFCVVAPTAANKVTFSVIPLL